MAWEVVCKPMTESAVRGIAVFVATNEGKRSNDHEVGRVAFVRADAEDPSISFSDKLEAVIERAQLAADVLNDTMDTLDRQEQEAVDKAARVLDDLLAGRDPAKLE